MRAALLLLILGLPALAQAQLTAPAGQVIPVPGDPFDYSVDPLVNLEECDPANDRTIELQWNVQLEAGASLGSGGVFRVFASSVAPPDSTTGVRYCDEQPRTDVAAGKVGEDIRTTTTGLRGQEPISASELVQVTGRTCASDAARLHVCVHFYPYNAGTTVPGERRGAAYGTLTISTEVPNAPRLDGVEPGNERLYAFFTAATTGAEAPRFRIVARPVDPTVGPERTADVGGSGGSVAGLVNTQPYEVVVRALSTAGNPSADSNAETETPLPGEDFWDRYKGELGVEEGGCAAGAAGPLALLGLAAAFALARPRARRRP